VIVGVFVRFRAPLHLIAVETDLKKMILGLEIKLKHHLVL
jgi:hypothetical protein